MGSHTTTLKLHFRPCHRDIYSLEGHPKGSRQCKEAKKFYIFHLLTLNVCVMAFVRDITKITTSLMKYKHYCLFITKHERVEKD